MTDRAGCELVKICTSEQDFPAPCALTCGFLRYGAPLRIDPAEWPCRAAERPLRALFAIRLKWTKLDGMARGSDEPDDAALLAATRAGDTEAFGRLYRRHVGAARRLAASLATDRGAAEELVSEAFAKVLAVLQRGGGPDAAFRAYLHTALRNAF